MVGALNVYSNQRAFVLNGELRLLISTGIHYPLATQEQSSHSRRCLAASRTAATNLHIAIDLALFNLLGYLVLKALKEETIDTAPIVSLEVWDHPASQG
ncbi:hypothetical protein AXG93_146s1270 [Marchantia polymorpha subsp. ruderalis]|uniref:Uncharacterized protein n=1 Tax=Marchantia polymorpha subsp. ruderalis TaxID=1480154 RepID=A0A176W8V7_MARPO|nr:hypothetical protein AXG93_146s1270 [Marchantia polymorpha subsp. ruderalis]